MQGITQPPKDAFSILCQAWKLWQPQNDKGIPYKSSMNLRDIVKIMPYIAVMDWQDNKDGVFRLIGEQIKLLYKSELTGNLLSSVNAEHEVVIECHKELLSALINYPIGTLNVRKAVSNQGDVWTFETVSLPLLDQDGKVAHSIVCGTLVPPKSASQHIWNGNLSFDLAEAVVDTFTPIDVGGGAPEFSAEFHSLINIHRTISIDRIIQ